MKLIIRDLSGKETGVDFEKNRIIFDKFFVFLHFCDQMGPALSRNVYVPMSWTTKIENNLVNKEQNLFGQALFGVVQKQKTGFYFFKL